MSEYAVQSIHLRIVGTAAPKGSSRAMLTKAGAAINVPSGSEANKKQLKSWRSDVIDACKRYRVPNLHPTPVFDPKRALSCAIIFRVPTPGTLLRSDKLTPRDAMTALAPTGRDVDKLMRSTWDAITQSQRIWLDDSRVALGPPMRRYVLPGDWQGAEILITYDAFGCLRWTYDKLKAAEAEIVAAREKGRPKKPQGAQQELLR